jgi:uncharacterized protein (DUF305 family)
VGAKYPAGKGLQKMRITSTELTKSTELPLPGYGIPFGAVLLLVGLLIGIAGIPTIVWPTQGSAQGASAGFTGGANYGTMQGSSSMMGTSAPFAMMNGGMMGNGMMMGDVDRYFIEQMIPHHQDAINMADLALQKVQHAELKALAANMKSMQSAEIEKMRGWYANWYGMDVPTVANSDGRGMMGPGTGGMSGMGMNYGMGAGMRSGASSLANAKDFDKAFIVQMIPHHQMAVMMSTMVLVQGKHPELRDLARSIIDSQSVEIEQMSNWYQTWYGASPGGLRP